MFFWCKDLKRLFFFLGVDHIKPLKDVKEKPGEHFLCKCLLKAKGSDDMSASVLWFDILWP